MRKSLILMLIATLLVGAFLVSCNSDIASESSNGDKLVQVSIAGDEKGISATLTQDDADNYYWYYSATKTDSSVYRTGQTAWKAVKNGPGLKGANLGYFSTGDWKFSFYGYKTDGKESKVAGYVYYQEDISVKVTDTTYITVALKEGSLASTATVVFSSLNWKYEPENGTNYNATLEALNNQTATMYFEYKADGADSYTSGWASGTGTITSSASDATATFSIANSELDATSLGKNYKLKYWVQIGEETVSSVNTIDVVAYHGSTITLSVDSSGVAVTDNEEVKQVIVNDYIVAISSKSKQTTEMSGESETKTNTAAITFTANVSETIEEATVVSFPAESISTNTVSSDYKVEMEVVVYQTEAAQAKFVVETAERSAFAGLDLSAALITTTTVEEETTTNSEAIETFNNQSVSVTTYIAKGLTGVDVKYTGITDYGNNTHPSNVSYNSETGALTFKTTHFSEFVVAAEQNVYDKTNNTGYKLSAEGKLLDKDNNVVEADSTHEYLLLDSTKANSVNDAIDVFNAGFNWSVVHEASDTPNTTDFDGGYGTKLEPYLIASVSKMQNISEYYDSYNYYKVNQGTATSWDCTGWVPVKLHGSFNGNGIHFTNVTAFLFYNVGYQLQNELVILKNFDATMNISGDNSSAALVRNVISSGKTVFSNVKVHGYLEGLYNMGSFYNYGTTNYDGVGSNYEVEFDNCISDATLVCTSGNTIGGLFGHSYEGEGHSFTLRVNNSSYTGHMYLTNSSGKGNKYYGMTSNYNNTSNHFYFDGIEDTFDNGSNKNAGAYTNSTKILKVSATKENDAYKVVKQDGVAKIVATVTAQLTAYDTNNVKIQNLSGITLVLSSTTFNTPEDTQTVLERFSSVSIILGEETYGASIDNNELKVKLSTDSNYKSGAIRLQVTQYNDTGAIVSAGTIDLATCEDATSSWIVK